MTLPKYDLNWCKNYAKQHNGECLSPQYLGRTTKHLYRCEDVRVAMSFMRHHLHIYTKSHGAMNAATEILPIL